MTSAIPVVTLNVFGDKRGPQVYGYMFAEFGFAGLYALILVTAFQQSIGFDGMFLLMAFITAFITGGLTWRYKFDEPF